MNRWSNLSKSCLKNTSHLWLAITLTRVNGFRYFDRNATDKVSSQQTLYYATSGELCFCTTWQNGKHEKLNFSLSVCIAKIQPVVVWVLQSFWVTSQATEAAVWLPKSCNQCVQLGAFGGRGPAERKLRALQQLDCVACTHKAPVRCLLGFLSRKVMQKH